MAKLEHFNSVHAKDAAKIVDGFRSIDAVLKLFNFFDGYSDPEVQRLLKK